MDMEQFTYDIQVITELFKLQTQLTSPVSDLNAQINNILNSQLKKAGYSNLSVLKLFLHLKYNLIKEGHSSKVILKPENLFKNINFQEKDNILQELGDFLKIFISVIAKPVEFCKLLINKVMNENDIDENYFNLVVQLVKFVNENEEIADFRKLTPQLSELIIKAIAVGIPNKANGISIIICPSYLKLSNDYEILKKIYKIIFSGWDSEKILLEKVILLCSLSDLLFMDVDEKYTFEILYERKLSDIITVGLKSRNRKLRKLSLFLLKYSINTAFSKLEKFNLHTEFITFNETNKSLCFRSWQNFILLYETLLHEKLTHIIMPALNLLDDLEYLPPQWETIIYQKLLVHENNVVRLYGIDRILDCKFLTPRDTFLKNILTDLFLALNDMYLYQNGSNNHIGINVKLQTFFEQLISTKISSLLYSSIARKTDSWRWLSVPFFNICYCLLRAMQNSTKITVGDLITQRFIDIASGEILNVYIRNALYWILFHCLQYFYKNNFMYGLIHCDTKCPRATDDSCNKILNKFKHFDFLMEKCQITINSQHWNELKKWFKTINAEDYNKFLITYEYIFKISARMLLLLYDAQIITEQQFYMVINKHYEQFSNISTSPPSLNITQLNESFRYLIHLLEETNHATRHSELKKDLFIHINKLKMDFFKYCLRSIKSMEECDVDDVDDIDFYVKAFRIILNDKLNFEMFNACLQKIDDNSSLAVKYFCLAFINDLVKKIDGLREEELEFLGNFSSLLLNNNKKLFGNFYKVLCDTEIIYYSHFETVSFQNESYCKRIVPFIFKSLEDGGQESILKTMELIQHVLPSLIINDDSSDIKKMMTLCCDKIIQLEKSSSLLFWDAIQQFVQTFICKELLLHEDHCHDVIKYGNDILTRSQQIRGLAKILYDQIFTLIQDEIDIRAINLLIPLIVEGLLFGPSFRPAGRVVYDTIKLIKTLQNKYIFNNVESKLEIDSVARIRSLEAVALIKERTPSLLENIFSELLSTYDRVNRPHKSANSDLHRIKNRCLQSMLYFHPNLNEDQNERLFNFLLKVLIEESPQESVRHLMEWLFILTIHKEPSLITKFEEKQQEMFEKRISSLTSVITVMYHLCLLNLEVFFEKTFNLIAPLTMSSDFNVRLYAQVTLCWLLKKTGTKKEFAVICKKGLRESFDHLKQDFFLTVFSPLEHLSIETIFSDFPRLLNFTDDSLDLNYFEKSLFEHFYNTNDALKHCRPHDRLYRNNKSKETNGAKLVVHNEPTLNTNKEVANEKTYRSCGELIVVTSLIKEVLNLGELYRTCKLFGIKEFIMDNVMYTEHKEFQNLSMSTKKWLKVTEIKETALKEYLLEMKTQNYTIIACDRSDNSVRLKEYEFPEKSILVLGNEEDGIPENLLGLIDVCVEIPQYCDVRSLNVYEKGTLTISQYALQYILKFN